VLGSIGSVGDAHDNAVAESFVDSFKTELIADRVWADVAWFNNERLHEALGDRPPRDRRSLRCEGRVTTLTRSKLGTN
jgi:transposase InsO family protein